MQKITPEQQNRHIYLAQAAINSLLRFSLENITLEGFLKCGLSVILSAPPFSITSKGAIYLIDGDSDILLLKAQHNLPLAAKKFKRFPLAQHPCSKGISGGQISFLKAISDNYKFRKISRKSYDYYCVPLLYSGHILGVLDIFLKSGHKRIKREEEFLIATANTLAGVIQRMRFQEQLQSIQCSLAQSEKLSALGKFASGIAHEVKNPLGIILGGVEFLEQKLISADKEVKTILAKIKKSTLRANSLLGNLLKFAMPAKMQREKVKPKDLIDETISLIKYRAPLMNIKIITKYSQQDISVEVDRNQIEQVLFNLLMNAVEAMPQGGWIKIKLRRVTMEKFLNAQVCCIIEISDNGEGIPEKNLSKLFEPFFTTKRDKNGTGLGLPISKFIVESHKGQLIIHSRPGKGTTAKIILPVA